MDLYRSVANYARTTFNEDIDLDDLVKHLHEEFTEEELISHAENTVHIFGLDKTHSELNLHEQFDLLAEMTVYQHIARFCFFNGVIFNNQNTTDEIETELKKIIPDDFIARSVMKDLVRVRETAEEAGTVHVVGIVLGFRSNLH